MNTQKKQAFLFIGLVFLFSWILLWGPLAIFQIQATNLSVGEQPVIWALLMFILNGFMPSILGILLYFKFDGKAKSKERLKSIFKFKHGVWKLHLKSLLLFGMILVLQIILYTVFIGSFDFRVLLSTLPQIIPLIILGPFSEEIGWRGFLQDKLRGTTSLLVVSLIIGIIWALWHLPLFFIPGTTQFENAMPFIPFLMNILVLSVWMGFIGEKAKGSIGVAVFIHWFYTYFLTVFTLGSNQSALASYLSVLPTLVLIVVFLLMDKQKFLLMHRQS